SFVSRAVGSISCELTATGSRRTVWRPSGAAHPRRPTRVFVAAPARGRRRHRSTAGELSPGLITAKRPTTPFHGRCEAGVREAIQARLGVQLPSVSYGGQAQ